MSRLQTYMNDTKILDFPMLSQAYEWDCGITAFNMILAYAGHEVRQQKLMDAMIPYTKGKSMESLMEEGAPIEAIKKIASSYGLKWKEDETLSVNNLIGNIDKGWPTLMMMQAWSWGDITSYENEWDNGHYVVCIGYNDKEVFFADPASIKRVSLPKNSVNSRWHGWNDSDRKINNWGIVFMVESNFSWKAVEVMG